MAAGLGFKDFVTGEVLTAADVDGYLMQNVWVFANAAARTAAVTSPQEGNFSYLKDTNSTEYYTGSAWVAVGGGGGGKVLQVVQGTLNSSVNTSSGSLTDTGLTVSITPSLATSKVLVMAFHNNNYVYESASAATVLGEFALIRGATQLQNIQIGGDTLGTQTGRAYYAGASFSYLDSPSTTSATTYKTQFRKTSGSVNVAIQSSATGLSSIIAMEIGA
jgi:hypothetical protein